MIRTRNFCKNNIWKNGNLETRETTKHETWRNSVGKDVLPCPILPMSRLDISRFTNSQKIWDRSLQNSFHCRNPSGLEVRLTGTSEIWCSISYINFFSKMIYFLFSKNQICKLCILPEYCSKHAQCSLPNIAYEKNHVEFVE